MQLSQKYKVFFRNANLSSTSFEIIYENVCLDLNAFFVSFLFLSNKLNIDLSILKIDFLSPKFHFLLNFDISSFFFLSFSYFGFPSCL